MHTTAPIRMIPWEIRSQALLRYHWQTDASLNSTGMDASKGATANAERLLSDMVSGSSSGATKSHPQGTGPNGANKGPWTKEEDEMLIRLVNEYGTKQWSVVASHLKVRPATASARELYDHQVHP